MTALNGSTLWAQIFVDELARAGLQHVCIAPGSRSTPLTVAFAEHPAISVYSLLDERGAGFFALGMALTTNRPIALVCTSGTAASNFHPAVTEAFYAQVPLLVLTADRPHEMRHSGSNQTIDQVKMYGDHVRWFVDVTPPEANPPVLMLRSLRTLAARAFAAAKGFPPGPVHLNFPFRKPLEPVPPPDDQQDRLPPEIRQGRSDNLPLTTITTGNLVPSNEQIDLLTASIRQAARGLIICGPRCSGGEFATAITRLGQAAGYPILADALSGVRFGPHLNDVKGSICGGYETYLQPKVVSTWEPPQLILRFGAMPISKHLGQYIAAHSDSRQISISGNGVWQDDSHTLSHFIWADPAATCQLVTDRLASEQISARDLSWMRQFEQAEQQAADLFQQKRAERFFEGAVLAEVIGLMPPDSMLYVASSLPVRHLDQFAAPQPKRLRIFANRGASGIDGTIGSALGAAAAANQPLVLVIGDLAFYHDMNSLLALQRCPVKATIVLINNNGGGIFHRLPINKFDPPFTDLFVTPHGLTFEPVVRMFGAEYAAVKAEQEFRQAFQTALASEASHVIEIETDAVLHERVRREILTAVAN